MAAVTAMDAAAAAYGEEDSTHAATVRPRREYLHR